MNDEITRIEEEIEEAMKELTATKPGSDEYGELLEDIKALEAIKERKIRLKSELDTTERELKLKEDSAYREYEIEEKKNKVSRWEHTAGIIKTAVIGVFTIVGTIITVNAEQTQVISDKAIGLVSKIKNTIR